MYFLETSTRSKKLSEALHVTLNLSCFTLDSCLLITNRAKYTVLCLEICNILLFYYNYDIISHGHCYILIPFVNQVFILQFLYLSLIIVLEKKNKLTN